MKEHIFGIFPCLAALRANRRRIYKVIAKDDIGNRQQFPKSDKMDVIVETAKEKGLKIEYRPKAVLDKIVGNRPHQNIIMTCSSLKYENLDECGILKENYAKSSNERQATNLWIALDQVQDPMNFGAILRTVGYFGVSGIIASAKNSCSLSPTVSKASAGTMEWMKIYGTNDLPRCLQQLSSYGWEIIGSTMPDDATPNSDIIPCQNLMLKRPTMLVLGNEGTGIRDEVLNHCTKLTTIRSSSKVFDGELDSLNVSVATGILIHSLLQQR